MRKRIAASLYTRPGDPMKIDCGYRPNGVIRMFQAVSLEGDVEAAKGLAYSAPQLREGVQRVESAKLELTAVVEPLRAVSDAEDEAMERYRFGVEAMERAGDSRGDGERSGAGGGDGAGGVASLRKQL